MGGGFDRGRRCGPFSRAYQPWWRMWQQVGVTGAERGVLDALCSVLRFEDDGRAYASCPRDKVADFCGRSETAVRQLTHSLLRKGVLVVKESAHRGHAASYWICPTIPWPPLEETEPPSAAPTYRLVSAFFSERKLTADPRAFFDFYESRGWVTASGEQVTDWRRLALAWDRRERKGDAAASRKPGPEVADKPDAPSVRSACCDEDELAMMTGSSRHNSR